MIVKYGQGFEVAEPLDMRDKVDALQRELLRLPQCELETRHYFHGGMYCREVLHSAGVTLTGKVHRKEHFFMVVSGTVSVTTDDGVETITGPRLINSMPGTKRAAHADTDSVIMTFHVTNATNVEDAELELVESDSASPFLPGNRLRLVEVSL